MNIHFRQNGYVALLTALIVSLVVWVAALTLGFSSFISRESSSSRYYKEESGSLASACVAAARLKLISNPTYAGNETIALDGESCKIISVARSGPNYIISAQGMFNNSYTDLRATVDSASAVVDWQDLEHF